MGKFLFIDDEYWIRMTAQHYFEDQAPDDSFVFATNFDEGVKALADEGGFDGVMSDLNYPGKKIEGQSYRGSAGGLDLLEHVQQQGIKIPYVILTGRSVEDVEQAVAARGMKMPDKVFMKPVGLDEVLDYLKKGFSQENRPVNRPGANPLKAPTQ